MLFKDNFYSIIDQKEVDSKVIYSIKIDEAHSIFEGHFPDNPVTPGVVQIEIVKELVHLLYGENHKLLSIGNCKFLSILNPMENSNVNVELSIQTAESLKVNAVIKNDNATFFKMSAIYS